MAHTLSGLKLTLLLGRSSGGGTEAHATWLSGALREAGVAAELYPLFPSPTTTGLKQEVLETLMLRYAYRRFLRHARAGQPDLVICFGRVANSLGHRLQQDLPGLRLIATCRTNRRLPADYHKTLVRADAVLVNSNWAAARVRALPGLEKRAVKVIPNALLRPELLTLEQNETARAQACQKLGLEAAAPVLCMLAHFVRGKNQEALIRMLARGGFPPQTQLLLAGEGPGLPSCHRLARRLGVAGRVHFPGRVDRVEPIFQASDLLVSTSLRDSMPNALVEAQAAGLPVVAYDVAGVGETFLHGRSGQLIPQGDESALAAAVRALLKDRAGRAAYGSVARNQALSRFKPGQVLAFYLERFNCLLSTDTKV